ncbi:hypothetical protein [Haladaptatus sp. DFWS20]|uniref:hypothetical protein n=1 Tax=Haladaptatus sp. DFWS20 TaxID=3403467 RepID=UPI003EB7C1C6
MIGFEGHVLSITDVSAIPVEMAVKPLESELGLAPYVSNHDSVETVTRMLVKVKTDEDVTGWGEMLVGMKSAAVTKAVVDDVIARPISSAVRLVKFATSWSRPNSRT